MLHDEDLAQAIIDRVLERGRLFRLDGPSIRTLHVNLHDAYNQGSDQTDEVISISGTHTGASFEIGGGVARYTCIRRIGVFGRVGWLHREQDVFRGTPVLVGGGNWIYPTPGVGILIGKGVNVQAKVKSPLYRSLSNKQLDSRAIFQFGISRVF